jgi:SAM-dependent methyltransferase
MDSDKDKQRFLTLWEQVLEEKSWRKVIVSQLTAGDAPQKIVITPVLLKGVYQVKFVSEFATRHLTNTFSCEEGLQKLANILNHREAREAYIYAAKGDYQLKASRKGVWKLMERRSSAAAAPESLSHNREKAYLVSEDTAFLKVLGISSSLGKVYAHSQKKYRQINRFIEILLPHLKKLPVGALRIADLGSGHGYLTFALYHYLTEVVKREVRMEGVELRADLVSQCNQAAADLEYSGLHFTEADILDYEPGKLDVCIALHACDIATDRAILTALSAEASLIVLAPCCHKQVRKSMTIPDALRPLLRHGVFMERTAEMLTDAIRVLYLEKLGYKVKTLEFIGVEHTPKNVMILAEKASPNTAADEAIARLKEKFGLGGHYLDAWLGESLQ